MEFFQLWTFIGIRLKSHKKKKKISCHNLPINTFAENLNVLKSPSVLVCPLDWGIGHATRCVPLIRKFSEHGFKIVLAADGRSFEFLRKEFPDVKLIRFPGPRIRYPHGSGFTWKMLCLSPRLLTGIFREHHALKKILRQEKPDLIFSDNRYGLWSRKCKSIFMTHQLQVIPPRFFSFSSGIINVFLRFFIRKFDECWVPDDVNSQGLAGKLSHPEKTGLFVQYIGILSRFEKENTTSDRKSAPAFDFMVILSGPEPQRTIFEEQILRQLGKTSLKGIVVRGIPEESDRFEMNGNINVFAHLETNPMKEYILASKIIICRPGYSTIMDLVSLGKRAVFIPTPGQTEQEYLAGYLMKKKLFYSVTQIDFELSLAIQHAQDYHGLYLSNDYTLLDQKIREISEALIPLG